MATVELMYSSKVNCEVAIRYLNYQVAKVGELSSS